MINLFNSDLFLNMLPHTDDQYAVVDILSKNTKVYGTMDTVASRPRKRDWQGQT